MPIFPELSTGAITQYPSGVVTSQPIGIVRFIDSSDQRWLMQGSQLKRWQIRLDLLNEDELRAIETFFEGQQGEYSNFTFTDPSSGTAISNCRFGGPELLTEYVDVDNGATSLWIVETNG